MQPIHTNGATCASSICTPTEPQAEAEGSALGEGDGEADGLGDVEGESVGEDPEHNTTGPVGTGGTATQVVTAQSSPTFVGGIGVGDAEGSPGSILSLQVQAPATEPGEGDGAGVGASAKASGSPKQTTQSTRNTATPR